MKPPRFRRAERVHFVMETNGLIFGDNRGYVQALSKYYRLGAADAIEFILDGVGKMNAKNGCDLQPSIGPIRMLVHHLLFLHGGAGHRVA